ncbi:UNVERIFIED_CONTAM: hypothetical protein Sradi_3560000 [Sesamum radiatum]|uniref:Uncharacterized protein n=1 Tax=Sesamum radiatum TaxID=300843 RepID=A0AAW2QG77_SESRA
MEYRISNQNVQFGSIPSTDFLEVLARVKKYMNLEDAWLVKGSNHYTWKENELPSSRRNMREFREHFDPFDPKNEHYTPLITNPARMLMVIDRLRHPALQWSKGSEEGP